MASLTTPRDIAINQAAVMLESRGATGTHDEIVDKIKTKLDDHGFIDQKDLQNSFGLKPPAATEVASYAGDGSFQLRDAEVWANGDGAATWATYVATTAKSPYQDVMARTVPTAGFQLRR